MYAILECHVVVRYVHHKVEYGFAVLCEWDGHFRSLMIDMASLDVAQGVVNIYGLLYLTLGHFQSGCVVGKVEDKTKR